MAKFSILVENEKEGLYIFYCPGCECGHGVRFRGEEPRWDVSGVAENKPTVSPSILANGQYRCHSFVKDGMIQYLPDSDHHLAGQTVELPDSIY